MHVRLQCRWTRPPLELAESTKKCSAQWQAVARLPVPSWQCAQTAHTACTADARHRINPCCAWGQIASAPIGCTAQPPNPPHVHLPPGVPLARNNNAVHKQTPAGPQTCTPQKGPQHSHKLPKLETLQTHAHARAHTHTCIIKDCNVSCPFIKHGPTQCACPNHHMFHVFLTPPSDRIPC